MVADLDKGGEKEEEYFSEVTGEEHIEGEDSSFKFNDPLANVEIEDAEVVPQKPSAMKKVGMAVVIVVVALIVSMYLTHKQKMKEAAEMGKTNTEATTPSKALPEIKTDMKPADKSAANESSENKASETTKAETPAVAAPAPDNASLAAAISKGVSPVAPVKSDTDLAAATSKGQVAPVAAAPVATKAVEKPATPATKSEPEKTVVKPEENVVAKAPESSVKELPAKVSEPTAATTVSAETPKIMGRIDDLNLQAQANQTKISDLSTRLDTIDKSMSEMNKTLAMLEKKLNTPQAVAPKVEAETPAPPVLKKAEKSPATNMQKKVNVVAERPGKSHHPKKILKQQELSQQQTVVKNQSMVAIPYVIRAIVPGRAWIERPLAGVISVMEGDYVPGVGKVVTIDQDNGEVTLDTGDVIKYGMDDH